MQKGGQHQAAAPGWSLEVLAEIEGDIWVGSGWQTQVSQEHRIVQAQPFKVQDLLRKIEVHAGRTGKEAGQGSLEAPQLGKK